MNGAGRHSSNREVRSLIKAAISQGWSVEQTKNNHIKFTAPSGTIYYTGGTVSDWRAHKNLRAFLRTQGLDV